jgi:hypothetical protein
MEELEINSLDDEMDHAYLAHVAECCGGNNLKILKLNGFKKIPSSFTKIVENNTHLSHLDVGNSCIGDDELIDFITSCSSTIKTIKLERNSSLENTTFMHLCCCKMLTSLNICGCTEVDLLTITTILRACVNIHDLNVRCCDNIINDEFLTFLSNQMKGIKSLCIHNSIFSSTRNSKTGITDTGIKALCNECKSLECLDIGRNMLITMSAIIMIVKQLNKLKRISCSLLNQLDQTELLVIMSAIFSKVEVIDLVNLALEGIPHPISDGIPSLIHTRKSAIEKQPWFQAPSSTSYFESSSVRLMLCRDRFNLKKLKLNNLCGPRTVLEVFHLGFLQLKSIHLTNCFKDENLSVISVYCPGLEKITLIQCRSITDCGVRDLIDSSAETLVSFTCFASELVSDLTVLYLAAKCSKTLQKFDMTGCDTEYSSVVTLIEKCKVLTCVEYTYNDPDTLTHSLDHFIRHPDSILIKAFCQRDSSTYRFDVTEDVTE